MAGLYDAWAKRCGVIPYDKLPKAGGPGIPGKPGGLV